MIQYFPLEKYPQENNVYIFAVSFLFFASCRKLQKYSAPNGTRSEPICGKPWRTKGQVRTNRRHVRRWRESH